MQNFRPGKHPILSLWGVSAPSTMPFDMSQVQPSRCGLSLYVNSALLWRKSAPQHRHPPFMTLSHSQAMLRVRFRYPADKLPEPNDHMSHAYNLHLNPHCTALCLW